MSHLAIRRLLDGPIQAVRVFMVFLLLVFQLGPAYVMANPAGEQVVAGSAAFDRSGSTLTITTSDQVIINWQDFSIQAGELTKFVQPSAMSSALNRVVSGNPSAIYGTLQANGQVFLINPNGILIGSGASIDTAGFVASTLDLSNEQFLLGQAMNFTGSSTASVENQGKVSAIGGDIVLISREVRNSGELHAPQGTIALAAGQDVLLAQSGEQRVFVRPVSNPSGTPGGWGVHNSGLIDSVKSELRAHGNLYALAINNSGTIRASGSVVENGRIFLVAEGGNVAVGGLLKASGGSVAVTGEKVSLNSANIDVSGENGGGTVRIGGGLQGQDGTIANARETSVSADSVIRADAQADGSGGTVVVWSDDRTTFEGSISARGSGSGAGGFAEVSGKEILVFRGAVDLRADSGPAGTLLLDPKNIAIMAGGTDPVAGNSTFADNAAGWSLISGADLSTAIDSASVTLQANTDIFVNDDVTGTTFGNGLTLQAGRMIVIEQDAVITLNGGDFSATINDDAAQAANRDAGTAVFAMESGAQILTGGGNVTVNHGNQDGTGEGEVRIGIDTSNDGAAVIDAGAGTVNITGTGSATGNGYGISLGNGSSILVTSGDVNLSGSGDGNNAGIRTTGGANVIGGPAATGDILLAARTATGSDSISLADLSVQSTGEVTLQPLDAGTSIGVAGGAGTFGLSSAELGLLADGFSMINIGRSDGTGAITVDTFTFADSVTIQSAAAAGAGSVSVTGDLATSGAGDSIELYAGKSVTITGSVTSNDGDITISANPTGTYAGWTMGVDLNSGGTVSSGNGDILITGTGGDAAGDWKIGIRLQTGVVQSTGGDITLQGTGGTLDSHNPGVLVEWAGGSVTTVSGDILLVGSGGGQAVNNWGVSISDSGAVSATGAGTVTITGTGGGGTDTNYGVRITGSGSVSVDSGNLQITGTVNNPSGQWNHGVDIDSGGQVLSDNGGTITIDGVGGDGTLENHGVRIADNNTLVQSNTGNVLINGQGGAGSQEGNRGIIVEGGADVASTGSATLTLNGDGGLGAWGNHGIIIAGSGTTVSSTGGNIAIDGAGAAAGGGWNVGVWIFADAQVTATGSSQISIAGAAGNGGANGDNWGVMIEGGSTLVSSVNGNIAISGVGSGTTDQNNVGLYIRTGVDILSTGAGDISLSGSGAGTAAGIVISGGANVFGGPAATGDITLTAHTASGSDSISLADATFQSTGALLLQPLNAGTSIGLAGESGTFNLSSAELALFQDGFSGITIGRANGTGAVGVGAYTFADPVKIQSAAAGGAGVVTIAGALATSTAGDAIELYAGRGVVVNADVTSNDGDITIKGNESGTSTGFSFGADVNAATVSAGAGDVLIVGKGGDTGNFNIGIRLTTGAVVETTSGDITLDGTGGPGGSNNYGVLLEWASTTVQSTSGDISMMGVGGGTGADNIGVLIQGTSIVQNTSGLIDIQGTGSAAGTSGNSGVKIDFSSVNLTDGNLTVTGIGGGSSNDNYGILFNNGATIDSVGLATITLDGTGGDGTWWNVGTYLIGGGTAITSDSAAINVTGVGGNGSASENFGVVMALSALIESTGSAPITLTGMGGDGTWGNQGIAILDVGTTVTTVDGDITMNGTGGVGSQGWNVGLRMQNGTVVASTGTGRLLLTGNGTAGVEDNWGFWMDGATVTSNDADIVITGTAAGTSQTNYGILIENASTIENLGSGDVTLVGTGGDGDWGNHGVYIKNAGTDVCVEDGALLIQGFGGDGFGGWNVGVIVDDFAVVEACNNGSVTIEATAGAGTNDNWGFWARNGVVSTVSGNISILGIGNGSGNNNIGAYIEQGNQILSDSGNVLIDGRGAGSGYGIRTTTGNNDIGLPAGTGDLTLIASSAAAADSLDLSGAVISGTGNLTLRPLAAATTIGLGGGAGTFNLSGAELAAIQDGFTLITIGRTDGTGAVTIGASTFNDSVSVYGGATTVSGAINAGASDVLLKAAGTLTLSAGITANNATLVTGTSFINTAGATPFTVAGRFLIYSDGPGVNTLGGLAYNFEQYSITYPTAPSQPGNGLLYAAAAGPTPVPPEGEVMLERFAESYDQFERYQLANQNLPVFYVGDVFIGYAPAQGMDPGWMANAMTWLSSFNLPVEDREHRP